MNNPTLPSERVEITAPAQSNPTPLHHQVTVHTATSNVNAMILHHKMNKPIPMGNLLAVIYINNST
jgi:hypothetical protein